MNGRRAAFLLRLLERWSFADLQAAFAVTRDFDGMVQSREAVPDPALRRRIQALDGCHLASDALLMFADAVAGGLPRQLGETTHAETLQALGRILDWWTHVGLPVCERLAIQYSAGHPRKGGSIVSEERPVYLASAATPDAQELLASPSTSVWLREALTAALMRDPVDAANDAEVLAEVLARRCPSSCSRLVRQ